MSFCSQALLYWKRQPKRIFRKNQYCLFQSEICVHDLSQKKPTKLRRKYNLYVWTIITVAVFYTLPVFHLMIAYQSVFSKSGNQDLCYYNFWCAKPYSVFSSFNNVFSNIAYILLGILYFLIVYTKNVNYKLRLEIDPHLRERGIPKHFGLFYAIAFALVMEGKDLGFSEWTM